MGLLISFVSSNEETWKGYLYMILLVVVNLILTVLSTNYSYLISLISMRLDSSLKASIYDKSLKLSSSSRKDISGEYSNTLTTSYLCFNAINPLN
jgi:ATP-binding cassette subfamily C (CFTR/MRP) protein 1